MTISKMDKSIFMLLQQRNENHKRDRILKNKSKLPLQIKKNYHAFEKKYVYDTITLKGYYRILHQCYQVLRHTT